MYKAAKILLYKSFMWGDGFTPLGKYLRVKWLGYLVGVCLTFKKTVKLFSKMFTFYISSEGL